MGKVERLNEIRRQQLGVIDRMGRPIKEGDAVVLTEAQVPIVKVIAVKPQLDPSGPKGFMVQGVASFTFFTPPGIPFQGLLRVASAPPAKPPEQTEVTPEELQTVAPENGSHPLLSRVSAGLRRLWPAHKEG